MLKQICIPECLVPPNPELAGDPFLPVACEVLYVDVVFWGLVCSA